MVLRHLQLVAWTLPFTNSWMLLWGTAAAVPILIHLWSRHRYEVVTWAAMEQLLAAVRTSSRKLTIQQILLLVLRVAILLLVAAALANPTLTSQTPIAAGLGAGGRTHWVLVVDSTYSMDSRAADQSNFEIARQRAIRLVESSTQGDGFTLVAMADPPGVIVRNPAFSRDDVVEELNNLRLSHQSASLAATMAEVETLMATARKKHPRLTQTRICILTDLGRNTWSEVESASSRQQIGRMAEHAQILLFEVGDPNRQNLAVTKVEALQSLVTVSRSIPFNAEIHNFGSRKQSNISVEVLMDGQIVLDRQLDIDAGAHVNLPWQHTFAAPGEHVIEVRITDDALLVDNQRWLSLPVRESIRTLCISGKPRAARFVALALSPEQTARPRIETRIAMEHVMLEEDLSQYDAVVLCNVGRFSSDEANLLREFVVAGGGLIVLLGDQVQSENYNEFLGAGAADAPFLPARLGLAVPSGEYAFDPLQYRHPIVAPFRGHEKSGLLSTPVWKYVSLEPDETAEVALAFTNGDAALVVRQMGLGRVILYAGAASGESVDRTIQPPQSWTEFHSWPSFPPLVQEMLSFSTAGQLTSRNASVGDVLEGILRDRFRGAAVKILTASGETEQIRLVPQRDKDIWTFDRTNQNGIYELRIGEPVETVRIYTANVDTRESNLARYDAALLPNQIDRESQEQNLQSPPEADATASGLYQYLLAAVTVLLLGECVLAWKFGRAA